MLCAPLFGPLPEPPPDQTEGWTGRQARGLAHESDCLLTCQPTCPPSLPCCQLAHLPIRVCVTVEVHENRRNGEIIHVPEGNAGTNAENPQKVG